MNQEFGKAMTSKKALNTKFPANEPIFLPITYTAYSNAWFDSYGILKSGHGAV
jgi:hypothetical protein